MGDIEFTIGDLSKVYGVSKQTLMYYEKIGLLVPAKVEGNGYRYYGIDECNRLEIILNLKKLNIPLKDIQDYADHRSAKMLAALLEDGRQAYDRAIDTLYTKKMKIETALYDLEKYRHMPRNIIFFQMEEEKRYLVTPCASPTGRTKDDAKQLLAHRSALLGTEDYWAFTIGSSIDADRFENGDVYTYEAYATYIGYEPVKGPIVIRPRGMYLNMYIDGPYEKHGMDVFRALEKFWISQGLMIAGDVYIEPILNHWTENSRDTYMTKITVPVERAEIYE